MSRSESIPPEVLARMEQRLAEQAANDYLGEASSKEISGEEISGMLARFITTLSSGGDPRVQGSIPLRGPRSYLHAVHGAALEAAAQDLFAQGPENADVMNLKKVAQRDDFSKIVAALFRAAKETPKQEVVLPKGAMSLRTYVLELEKQKGILDEEVRSLRAQIAEDDNQRGLGPAQVRDAWQTAERMLRAWDVIDEELAEKHHIEASETTETLPATTGPQTVDSAMLRQIAARLDEGRIIPKSALTKQIEGPEQEAEGEQGGGEQPGDKR